MYPIHYKMKKKGWMIVIKAVIFDLDNTLLDRDASVEKFIENQYDRLFLNHTSLDKQQYITRFIQLDNKGYTWKDKVYQQLVEEFLIEEFTWEQLLEDYISNFKNHCIRYPSLHELLTTLKNKNYQLGIISNGFGQFQLDNIIALKIQPFFDCILISEWEGIKKPDERIFHQAASLLNVLPNECLFVGDHIINDVEGAKNAGMKALWKNNELVLDDNREQIVDLMEILEHIN